MRLSLISDDRRRDHPMNFYCIVAKRAGLPIRIEIDLFLIGTSLESCW